MASIFVRSSRALLKATSFEAKWVSAQHSSEQKNLPFLGFNNVHFSKMQVFIQKNTFKMKKNGVNLRIPCKQNNISLFLLLFPTKSSISAQADRVQTCSFLGRRGITTLVGMGWEADIGRGGPMCHVGSWDIHTYTFTIS